MAYWWDGDIPERFWCEITDRHDIGADLKCPQTNESGRPYWSYSLIGSVAPGDVVFHYSTNSRSFVGASVAGGPVESRLIVWAPHGTVGRSKGEQRRARPGWWLPLYGYRAATSPLTLDDLQAPEEQAWIRAWLAEAQERFGATGAPLQPYPERLRAAQGYLTKMPRAFVERWPKLGRLLDALEGVRTNLEELGEVIPPKLPGAPSPAVFRPKNADDYRAQIQAGFQVRSRKHEALVKSAGECLLRKATVTTPHPVDLRMTAPVAAIFEAKIVGSRGPGAAIREAVGQLFEYRYFVGPRDAWACVLLDEDPGDVLVHYVEQELRLMISPERFRFPSLGGY